MKPILTPGEAGALDRESEARGVTAESLMERAGWAVARAAAALAGGRYGRRAVVVAGKGNNGGDGVVAARHLARWGIRVTALLLGDPSAYREPSASMLRRAAEAGVRIRPATAGALARELARSDVAIDAVFGTGFRGTPEDRFAEAIEELSASAAPVVAVDIPSGVNGETGAVEGAAVWASATVTFGAAKPGLLLYPGAERAGVIEVADIGFPPELLRSNLWLVEAEDVEAMLPRRAPDGHKRASGVVLVIGGSRQMTGAVRMMAEGAYRSGAGLVTVAVPEGILPVVEGGIAEATFLALPESGEGTVAPEALDALRDRLPSFDAVALGPGMTAADPTVAFVRALVAECPVPVVLDADALNAFAGRAGEIAGRSPETVLTPHAGELGRLLDVTTAEAASDRIGSARTLAAKAGATVVAKGRPTLVASPEGIVRLNPTGGPALSTGGTGDVLTGCVAALLGRGLTAFDAATAAAFLHGLAGELAGAQLGEGATALDVARRLPDAVLAVEG